MCSNLEQALLLFDIGNRNRSIGCTDLNDKSSRSHSIFVIKLITTNLKIKSKKSTKLFLVDLAGFEKVNGDVLDQTFEEAKNINQSLFALVRLINAFNDPDMKHKPYRESKLTQILFDSLGGNSKTCLVATVSPHPVNRNETLSTLRYGQRAQKIVNKPRLCKEHVIKEKPLLKVQTDK